MLVLLLLLSCVVGCAKPLVRRMETTAYCGCGECCGWHRGSGKYLKLDFWNRYLSTGRNKGKPYPGLTARGTVPGEPYPGLFSMDSLYRPWVIPFRIVFFPWLLLPKDGTIAADTEYYKFGTRMHVPGYGWGVIEDRGSAIKGADRLDLFMTSHSKALRWGRRKVNVRIEKK
ncbi:MAG: 3D domain-containing protein [Proteobacteria bacterium]|nr:3D domain-containing protein [Pseudomonadota bacterium]MBU1716312.1 3D domain-containing protein [Pseudomonadota bacterium]